MSQIKSKNTKPERIIFSILEEKGYKFERHYPIAGKPDIAFPDCKVAVFIDGEYWHGKDFEITKQTMSPFWLKKIRDNIKRDKKNKRKLRNEGWHVMRLWGKKVVKHPERALKRIAKFVKKAKST